MSRKLICSICFVLLLDAISAGLASAAEVTPHIYVDFKGTLVGTNYTLGPREIDTTDTFAAHNGTELVTDGLGRLTDSDGASQESFEFDASVFNNNGTVFTGTPFVVEAIFTPRSVSDAMAPIIDIGGQCFIRFHDGLSAGSWNGSTEVVDNNIQNIPEVGETHHYAIVYGGANIIDYYMDGVAIFQSDNGSPQQITKLISWGNIRHSSVDGGRQLRGEYDSVAFSTFTGTFDPEADFILPGGLISPSLAFEPNPTDGAVDVTRDVVLSWMAGDTAVTHDVYFGTVFDDVNNADRNNPMGVLVSQAQTDTSFDVDSLLEFGQTYYWRVDEVNGPTDYTIFKGEVWSFTVEPFSYAIQNVMATSNTTSASDQGPDKVVDGSGLDEDDQHSTNPDTMWVGSPVAGEPPYIQFEFDRVYKLYEMLVWNYNLAFEMFLGFGIKDATVEYSENGTDWTVLGDVVLNQAPGNNRYTYGTVIPLEGVPAKYVRLNIVSSYLSTASHGLAEVRFMYIPAHAREPQPTDGAINVALDASLSWRPGREAASHDVYLSTDPEALALVGTTTQSSFTPEALDLDATYYWQVIEINEAEVVSEWVGDVWTFSTQEYIEIDGFETYDDDIEAGTTIWQTWIDGLDDPSNGGGVVGYGQSPFAEQAIVWTEGQAMPFFYNNSSDSAISEADRTFDTAQDWTANGIKSLTLWFHGAEGNTGRLFVKINNTKVSYDGWAANIVRPMWQLWSIDLSSAGNVDNVTTLTIGVESAGSGVVYIDDIRLYPEVLDDVNPDITGPGDVVLGVPNDADWPAAETPDLVIDDNTATKFLHFKGATEPTGIQITPLVGATVVTEVAFISANDTPERDPASFELYGSNVSIDGPYTLIASGGIVDFTGAQAWPRLTRTETVMTFENAVAYTHYQVLFPTVRNPGSADSMQIAEVELIGIATQ